MATTVLNHPPSRRVASAPPGDNLESANGRWQRPVLPAARNEAVDRTAQRVDMPENIKLDGGIQRPATLDEKLAACRETLLQAWRELGIPPNNTDAFEHDCRLALNRARGWGFLAEHLPPAGGQWSDLILNSDGSVWTRERGGRHFKMLYARGELTLNDVWKSIGNLLVSTGDSAGAQARTMSVTQPTLDTKLSAPATGPNGEDWGQRPVCRIKIQHPVIAAGQGYPAMSMRFHADRPVTPSDLRAWQVAPDHVIDALLQWTADQLRIMIGGGTATGKTTVLTALLDAVPTQERIVKIEDPEEIWCSSPNFQTLEARHVSDASGMRSFSVADGVDDAMRMAPDRLIVGEVRQGDAAMALFRAMMSDHSGMTTFHSDSPSSMMHRLSTILRADLQVPEDTVPGLIEAAVDLYVQIGWAEDADLSRSRAMLGIYEIVNLDFIHPEDVADAVRYQNSHVGFRTLWRLEDGDRAIGELARRIH